MDPRELNFNCKYKLVKPVNYIDTNRVAIICYGHLRSFLECLPNSNISPSNKYFFLFFESNLS